MDKVYVVTDFGPGDGGKGGIVHALSCMQDDEVNLIIKRGGAQGSHGVCTSYKEKFNFSQWGCGTLEGIPTFCSEQMIISPVGLENESEALRRLGIYDPYTLLSIDPSCICATPFHTISSQLEELLLGKRPRGTIGTGVGRACRMANEQGNEITLYASELQNLTAIERKLFLQRDFYCSKYNSSVIELVLPEDVELAKHNLSLLRDEGFMQYCIEVFKTVGQRISLMELSQALGQNGTAIVECSHGILTDAEKGFKPHVSAIRTLPKFTNNMLREAGYGGRIINFAIHRAYEIRHGAGPMPTYDANFTSTMLPGSHKAENRWQGIVRAGAFDFNLFRHAVACSEETHIDGICLTWFDQVLNNNGKWLLCEKYQNSPYEGENYVEFLKNRARPIITERQVYQTDDRAKLFHAVETILSDYTDLPLMMLSVGPTELDKISSQNIRRL